MLLRPKTSYKAWLFSLQAAHVCKRAENGHWKYLQRGGSLVLQHCVTFFSKGFACYGRGRRLEIFFVADVIVREDHQRASSECHLLLLTILIVVVDNWYYCWQFLLLLTILVGQARRSQQKRSSPHGPAPIGLNSLSKTFNITQKWVEYWFVLKRFDLCVSDVKIDTIWHFDNSPAEKRWHLFGIYFRLWIKFQGTFKVANSSLTLINKASGLIIFSSSRE